MDEFSKCNLCPRMCNVDRNNGEIGFCNAPGALKIARYSLHMWEEPIVSGDKGSGTIFFSNCNLKCIFCQNYKISTENIGKEISIEEFKDICLLLQEKGAHNINLVTPTMYIPLIKEGLILAKKCGLNIPIVYNTSSYENVSALKMLDGLIDVYMPDFKYFDDALSIKYSSAPFYFKNATLAIEEMFKQVGSPVIENNLIKKGIIVRHLIIPGHVNDSKKIIEYLYNKYKDNIYISIMNQYTPVRHIDKYSNLNRTVNDEEYDEVINYACDIGVVNAFIQEGETQKDSFIPDFNIFDGT